MTPPPAWMPPIDLMLMIDPPPSSDLCRAGRRDTHPLPQRGPPGWSGARLPRQVGQSPGRPFSWHLGEKVKKHLIARRQLLDLGEMPRLADHRRTAAGNLTRDVCRPPWW